jgi:hypothetical protein
MAKDPICNRTNWRLRSLFTLSQRGKQDCDNEDLDLIHSSLATGVVGSCALGLYCCVGTWRIER